MNAPRLIRPMDGDKLDDTGIAAPVRIVPPTIMQVYPYNGSREAAERACEIIKTVGKTAYLWIRNDGRIKVAGEDYGAGPDEHFVGTYNQDANWSVIAGDIDQTYAASKSGIKPGFSEIKNKVEVKKKTRSVSHSVAERIETTVTTEHEETREPSSAILDIDAIPKKIAAPDPSPAIADTYSIVLARLTEKRKAVDAELSALALIGALRSKVVRAKIADILNDYVGLIHSNVADDELCDLTYANEAEHFSAIFSADIEGASIFERIANQLRKKAEIDGDCGAGGTDEDSIQWLADEKECLELAALIDGDCTN